VFSAGTSAAAAALLSLFGSSPPPSHAAFFGPLWKPTPQSITSDAVKGAGKITSGTVKSTGDVVSNAIDNATDVASDTADAIGSTVVVQSLRTSSHVLLYRVVSLIPYYI
jgi:hypothetical protein